MPIGFGPEDEHFRRLMEMIEQARRIQDALGPGYEIQRQVQRQQEAMRSQHAQWLNSVADDARRQKELMDSIATIRLNDLKKALGRQRTLLDETRLTAVAKAVADLNPTLEALRQARVYEDLYKWSRQQESQAEIVLEAAKYAVENAALSKFTGIEPAYLASQFTTALGALERSKRSDEPTDVLTFAIALAFTIAAQRPGTDPSGIFRWLVLPLLLVLMQLGADVVFSDRSSKELAARFDTAIERSHAPKRFIAIGAANLRVTPERTGQLIFRLPKGTVVEELDRDERGWRYIRAIGIPTAVEGWAYYRNLKPQ
jgi:hypothetical protein